jgi:prepilin-type N-terminal cleavage/methylation domain-containing protein
MDRRQHRDDGFTLVELMVVVLVIGILLAIAIPTFLGARSKSADAVATANVNTAAKTVAAVLASTGAMPSVTDLATMMPEFSVVTAASTRSNQISVMSTPQVSQLVARSSTGRCPMAIVRATGVTTTTTSSNCTASTVLWSGLVASSYLGSGGFLFSDDVLPVDVTKNYEMRIDVRSGDDSGGQINAGARHYIGFVEFDSDGQRLRPEYTKRSPGAVDTTLAAPLITGQTTMTLTSAAGWYNGTNPWYRLFTWWPYVSPSSVVYAPYTYSRNSSVWLAAYPFSSGTWDTGGVVGNTITLRAPWPGPDLPAGTPIRNSFVGGNYNYCARSYQVVPSAWTTYVCPISGIEPVDSQPYTGFRSTATTGIQVLVLAGYSGTGSSPDHLLRWKDASFVEVP